MVETSTELARQQQPAAQPAGTTTAAANGQVVNGQTPGKGGESHGPRLILGPLLRFQAYEPASNTWTGSVLIVCDKSAQQPHLVVLDPAAASAKPSPALQPASGAAAGGQAAQAVGAVSETRVTPASNDSTEVPSRELALAPTKGNFRQGGPETDKKHEKPKVTAGEGAKHAKRGPKDRDDDTEATGQADWKAGYAVSHGGKNELGQSHVYNSAAKIHENTDSMTITPLQPPALALVSGQNQGNGNAAPPSNNPGALQPQGDHATALPANGVSTQAPGADGVAGAAGQVPTGADAAAGTGAATGAATGAGADASTGAGDKGLEGHRWSSKGELLDSYKGFAFWRFDIAFQLTGAERKVVYWVDLEDGPTTPRVPFWLPSATQQWHWGFYSCNGFDDMDPKTWGGVSPVWRDIMKRHAENPMHAMIGGGDQLYCDRVFDEGPGISGWFNKYYHAERKDRDKTPFTQECQDEAERYYFEHYCEHWTTEVLRDALATIPQANMWDDHDIFDGWGSYPPHLQANPMFQGIFRIAQRFYLLFQQHTTLDKARQHNDMFGESGFSWLKLFGSKVAVLGLDLRSERSKTQVLKPGTYKQAYERIAALPASVKHLVLMTTVPVIFPKVPYSHMMLTYMSKLDRKGFMYKFLHKINANKALYSKFDEPELLDDLVDHWTAREHKEERRLLVESMQAFAQQRGIRVTFLTGDAHCAAVAQFYSEPKIKDHRLDHRFMLEVVSSAVSNAPPPNKAILVCNLFAKSKLTNPETREKMVKIFKRRYPYRPQVLGHRNWCEVMYLDHQLADVTQPPSEANGKPYRHFHYYQDSLIFTLRLEHPKRRDDPYGKFDAVAPPLILDGSALEPNFKSV